MKQNFRAHFFRVIPRQQIALLCLFLSVLAAQAQSAKPSPQATVPALLLSDIHFEPFWDPAKAPQLAAAPSSEWRAILAAAPSPDQPQRFAALQQSCHARGADTSFALMPRRQSSSPSAATCFLMPFNANTTRFFLAQRRKHTELSLKRR
jgi:hypothetical protein